MKSYEVTLCVEVPFTFEVTAPNAETANQATGARRDRLWRNPLYHDND